MPDAGNPRCDYCRGAGGVMRNGHWYPCQCVRPNDRERRAHTYMNTIGARNPDGDAIAKEMRRRDSQRKD